MFMTDIMFSLLNAVHRIFQVKEIMSASEPGKPDLYIKANSEKQPIIILIHYMRNVAFKTPSYSSYTVVIACLSLKCKRYHEFTQLY